MKLRNLLFAFWPVRWWRSGLALARGVRLHPTSILLGAGSQFQFGAGSVVGARARFDLGSTGRVNLGRRVWLASDVELQTNTKIDVGAGSTIQRRCTINGSTRLGRDCILAPNVFISSRTHSFRAYPHLSIRAQERRLASDPGSTANPDRPVWIQDDCWLGTNVVVGPGVTVGKGSVVGANSVVLKDVEPYSVVAGAPARLISRRLEWAPQHVIICGREEDRVYVISGAPVGNRPDVLVGFAPGSEEPLCIVTAIAGGAEVSYQATQSTRVRVADRLIEISPGEGRFVVDMTGAPRRNDSMTLAIHALPGVPVDGFFVSRVETTGK